MSVGNRRVPEGLSSRQFNIMTRSWAACPVTTDRNYVCVMLCWHPCSPSNLRDFQASSLRVPLLMSTLAESTNIFGSVRNDQIVLQVSEGAGSQSLKTDRKLAASRGPSLPMPSGGHCPAQGFMNSWCPYIFRLLTLHLCSSKWLYYQRLSSQAASPFHH